LGTDLNKQVAACGMKATEKEGMAMKNLRMVAAKLVTDLDKQVAACGVKATNKEGTAMEEDLTMEDAKLVTDLDKKPKHNVASIVQLTLYVSAVMEEDMNRTEATNMETDLEKGYLM